MRHIERIIAATDHSEHALRAKKRAAMLCEELGCQPLAILTVMEPEPLDAIARVLDSRPMSARDTELEQALGELASVCKRLWENGPVRFMPTVRFGRPADEIIARADEIQACLLVIGAHGSGFAGDLFLGSTADTLLRLATRPLLVVKNEPVNRYRRLLIPVDFSADSRCAAQLALQLAPQAHVTFLHTFEAWFESRMLESGVAAEAIEEYREEAAHEARRSLDRFIADLGSTPRSITNAVRSGSPVEAICSFAEEMQPDLIAMGKHGRFRLQERLLGSVTRRATNRAPCDVLVATAERRTETPTLPKAA